MRLKEFRIYGLFGMFDHTIELNLSENITILHAPNGYGKTVILNMIAGFFGGSLLHFRLHEFQQAVFVLDSGQEIYIDQEISGRSLFPDEETRTRRSYIIHTVEDGETLSYSLKHSNKHIDIRHYSPTQVERFLSPHVMRVAPGEWRDLNTGESMTMRRAIELYGDLIPLDGQSGPHPEWLEKIRSSITCRLIETQRLASKPRSGRNSAELTPAVKHYAQGLAASMERILAESANLSQSLDRTFPKRVLARLEGAHSDSTEFDVRESLKDLEIRRARLAAADLLDIADEDTLISHAHFGEEAKKVLNEYVTDTKKKLSVFDGMLKRIELFQDLINSRFQFKKMIISRTDGFTFSDYKGRPLSVESLSSGEQHELVLAYELIFGTPAGALLLIDEPEISLHIAWQRRFLADLRRAIELSNMDVLVSTHSPQLVAGDIGLVVTLKGPAGE